MTESAIFIRSILYTDGTRDLRWKQPYDRVDALKHVIVTPGDGAITYSDSYNVPGPP